MHGYTNGRQPSRIDDIPISSVYVDLEDVLADLTTAIFNHVDRAGLLSEPWPAGQSKEDRLGLTKAYLFNLVIRDSSEIWKKVKPCLWAKSLLTQIRSPIVIVTGGQWGVPAINDKLRWCERHLDGLVSDHVVIQTRQRLANKESLLIDDNPKNVDRFIAAGGHGLVFPRPWNADCDDRIVPSTHVLSRVMDQIRRRYLCAAVPESQARDMQYGQLIPELT